MAPLVDLDQRLSPLNAERAEGVEFPVTVDVASTSDPEKVYHVYFDEEGFANCQCKGYEYRQRCRHTAQARKQLSGDES